MSAIARAPIGVTRSVPETRQLLEKCLEEVVAVARARKIEMSTTAIADTLKFYDGIPPVGTTSLQRDIVDGKPSELDYWNARWCVSAAKRKSQRQLTHTSMLASCRRNCTLAANSRSRASPSIALRLSELGFGCSLIPGLASSSPVNILAGSRVLSAVGA